jgi:hypothetical protein
MGGEVLGFPGEAGGALIAPEKGGMVTSPPVTAEMGRRGCHCNWARITAR